MKLEFVLELSDYVLQFLTNKWDRRNLKSCDVLLGGEVVALLDVDHEGVGGVPLGRRQVLHTVEVLGGGPAGGPLPRDQVI